MLKSFILQPSIISSCLNTVAKRTLFNARLIFEKQKVAITEESPRTVVGKYGQRRGRRTWTVEETELLKKLVSIHGFKYTLISKSLTHRSVASVFNRCRSVFQDSGRIGPWTKEELSSLEKLTKSAGPYEDRIDWVKVQTKLPYYRHLPHIKLTWNNRFNPRFKHGKWSPEEIRKLKSAVETNLGSYPRGNQLNNVDWHAVSDIVGTRSSHQCLERFRWQELPIKKGAFTPEEDQELMDAVKIHGDGNFFLIAQHMNSPRSPRSLSHRYRYGLDPNADRSPWTLDEEMDLYHNLPKYNGSMLAYKKATNSNRNVRDMWNHYKKITTIMNKKQEKKGE